jgi:hypothetical protein
MHSPAFIRVRDAVLALSEADRARLARLLGHIAEPRRDLGDLNRILRMIGELDAADVERLSRWFYTWVNAWGQMPRATGIAITPAARLGVLQKEDPRR